LYVHITEAENPSPDILTIRNIIILSREHSIVFRVIISVSS
jgi:hypothetical protein